ncbi:unnamed protein product [Moneuplotes crassus]|uniref:Uncharacterized protein n=1 Tax=Euplotes crassus TaxID=5936 RepID=A0AAD1XNH0_EUPCR|nr:unnamed protein product [Moneuplotes crassus]
MEKASSDQIDKIDMDDPVIAAELEGRKIHQPYHNTTNYLPAEGGTGPGYDTFNNDPYPQKPDQYVLGNLEADENERENDGKFLDAFKKLRGEDDRQNFLIKVLSILALQVLLTVVIITGIWMNKNVKKYLQDNIWVYFTALALTIVVICAVACFRSIGRKVPYNYIALTLFTVFESIMLATITSFYDAKDVFISAFLALVMFTTLVVIALSTKRSVKTVCAMLTVAIVLSFAMIPFLIFASSRWVVILVSVVGLVVAAIYVVIDIDMITEKYGLDYDEYVFASIQLYLDLAMIFVYILALFGDRS